MNINARRAREIFVAAVAGVAPDQWDAYLAEACGDDAALRGRVHDLLRAHAAGGSFLQAPAPGPAADPPVREGPGAAIGPYRLLEQLGEGGFGVVFRAEQQQPVRRPVALKVLKPGMDTRQVVARFEAERQALALMDHPNIAHVFDGGTTESGRPYFVMELVRGVPITDFCDQSQLTPRERLGLFVAICQAVQHAHQKGIIHRDIKPSNVLVTLHDGVPVVKVIDFGIAKALGQQLTDKTLCTGVAQLIGTPLYMSPEQAEMGGLDIDTRSDLYSLGVLLYELLTGTTPFDQERLRQAGYDEMRRILREEEPPRPSARISTLGAAAATVSARRRSDPGRLSRSLRGELDWVVMKALEKDRTRRYETASAFAADVQRYLHDEPVLACPPSAAYRFRKFARRNQVGFGIAACVLVALAALAGSIGWAVRDRGERRAQTERTVLVALAEAETLNAQGWQQLDEPDRWQATVGLAESAVQRAEGLLAAGVATAELADRVRDVRAAVAEGARASRLRAELDRIRLEQAGVKDGGFANAAAAPLYAQALGAYGIDPTSPEEAAARVRSSPLREALLAAVDDWLRVTQEPAGRQRLEDVLSRAEPEGDAFRARWRMARARREGPALAQLAREAPVAGLSPAALVNLARDLQAVNEPAAVEQLLRVGQERHPDDFWLNERLGLSLVHTPKPEEAARFLTAAVALRPRSPGAHLNLGNALRAKGDVDGAIRCFRTALALDPRYAMANDNLREVLEARGDLDGTIGCLRTAIDIDPQDAGARCNLGSALHRKGDVDGAVRSYRSALAIDPRLVAAHCNLGIALQAKGDVDGALHSLRTALDIDPKDAVAHFNLGNALRAKGDVDGALRSFCTALDLNPRYAGAHCNLGNALKAKGDVDGAIRCYRAALAIDPRLVEAHCNLGVALETKGDLDGAVRCYRAALAINPQYAEAHCNLGVALRAKGDVDDALRSFRTALALDPKLVEAHYNLGDALQKKGDVDDAIRCYRTALALNPEYAEAHCNLGLALKRLGRFAEALAALQRGHALGSRQRGWSYPSARWVRDTQLLVEVEAKLPRVLRGEIQPADVSERLGFAWLCRWYKDRPATAARFYADAFAAEPPCADDLAAGHRYTAARAAALAGCGQGTDAGPLDGPERARLRRQALDWLRADLAAWQQQLTQEPDRARPRVQQALRKWRQDAAFAEVRGGDALARLPEAERPPWQQFWGEVEALARRTADPKK